jgi:hypothetical protein
MDWLFGKSQKKYLEGRVHMVWVDFAFYLVDLTLILKRVYA